MFLPRQHEWQQKSRKPKHCRAGGGGGGGGAAGTSPPLAVACAAFCLAHITTNAAAKLLSRPKVLTAAMTLSGLLNICLDQMELVAQQEGKGGGRAATAAASNVGGAVSSTGGRTVAATASNALPLDFVMECAGVALWGCLSRVRGELRIEEVVARKRGTCKVIDFDAKCRYEVFRVGFYHRLCFSVTVSHPQPLRDEVRGFKRRIYFPPGRRLLAFFGVVDWIMTIGTPTLRRFSSQKRFLLLTSSRFERRKLDDFSRKNPPTVSL